MARSTGSCYQNPSPQNSKMGLLCGRGAQKWGVVISPPHPEGSGGSIPCLATTLKVKCRFEGLWRRPLMEWVLWLFEHAKGNICLQFWHDNKKNVIYIYITCNIAWFHPPNSPYDWLVLNKPFIITDFWGHTKGVWSHSQQRLELLLVIAWDDAAKAKMESRMASRKLDLKKSPHWPISIHFSQIIRLSIVLQRRTSSKPMAHTELQISHVFTPPTLQVSMMSHWV